MTRSQNTRPLLTRASSLRVLPASWANLFSTRVIRIDPPAAFRPSDKQGNNWFRSMRNECAGYVFHNEDKAACIFHAPPFRVGMQLPFRGMHCLFLPEIAR